MTEEAKTAVCDEIVDIMMEYRRQMDERGYVDTPCGLEHMGDVWSLLSEWDAKLTAPTAL